MGIIREQLTNEIGKTEVAVVERTKRESPRPWEIVFLRIDDMGRMTPKQMCELGRWLQREGKRIGQQYKSNGAPKSDTHPLKG
jgi:hypothetical protein